MKRIAVFSFFVNLFIVAFVILLLVAGHSSGQLKFDSADLFFSSLRTFLTSEQPHFESFEQFKAFFTGHNALYIATLIVFFVTVALVAVFTIVNTISLLFNLFTGRFFNFLMNVFGFLPVIGVCGLTVAAARQKRVLVNKN